MINYTIEIMQLIMKMSHPVRTQVMQEKKDVYFNDIKSFSSEFSFLSKLKNSTAERPIMSGEFNYQSFTEGLNIHTSNAVETQNTAISSEVTAGMSFSFLFDGCIDFSLGSNRHQLTVPEKSPLGCMFLINNKKELFTRYLIKGMHIKKLTISVDKTWLDNRCSSDNDFNLIAKIFKQNGVYNWQPTNTVAEKAKALIDGSKETSLTGKLNTEQLTMELVVLCLDACYKVIAQSSGSQKDTSETSSQTLLQRINCILDFSHTLPELAQQLNISVSTLQRNFKQSYGINISEYITDRRLEQAKKLLILNELSIGETAFEVGYKHSSNFINTFKKKFDITPAAFVRLHKNR